MKHYSNSLFLLPSVAGVDQLRIHSEPSSEIQNIGFQQHDKTLMIIIPQKIAFRIGLYFVIVGNLHSLSLHFLSSRSLHYKGDQLYVKMAY